MPQRKIKLVTESGEQVTEIGLFTTRKTAPFPEWAIARCMSLEQIASKRELPTGVEAEIVVILMFRAHEVTRTSQLAKILTRDNATVCRALRRLEAKRWVTNLERGEWQIHHDLVYYGRWLRKKYGKHAS